MIVNVESERSTSSGSQKNNEISATFAQRRDNQSEIIVSFLLTRIKLHDKITD